MENYSLTSRLSSLRFSKKDFAAVQKLLIQNEVFSIDLAMLLSRLKKSRCFGGRFLSLYSVLCHRS